MNGVNWSDSPFTFAQWSCHLYIVFGDKSIPNDSNYQIRKAIMTKIRAPGPESQEAQFSWPPVIVISQSSIINHGTGGSKYWTQRRQKAHIFCATQWQWKQPSSMLLIILRHHLCHWVTLCSLLGPFLSSYTMTPDSLSWSWGWKVFAGLVLCSWCELCPICQLLWLMLLIINNNAQGRLQTETLNSAASPDYGQWECLWLSIDQSEGFWQSIDQWEDSIRLRTPESAASEPEVCRLQTPDCTRDQTVKVPDSQNQVEDEKQKGKYLKV